MREFYARQSGMNGVNTNMILGCVMMGLGVVGLLAVGRLSMFIGFGLMLVIFSAWSKRNPLLRLHDDHLEMKVAIAAPRRLVLYSEIEDVVEESPRKGWLLTKAGQRLRLPLQAIEPHERDELLSLLRGHAA